MSVVTLSRIAEAETTFDIAYRRRLPEMMALPPSKVVAVNLDIRKAVATVLGALAKLATLRPRLTKLAFFNLAAFDALEDYAKATWHAHSVCSNVRRQPDVLQETYEAAMKTRDVLRSDAAALAHRGLLDGQGLACFRWLNGYKNVAFDLMGVVTLFKRDWPQVEGRTAVTFAELQQAQVLGERLVAALGGRGPLAGAAAEAARVRDRAFTLLLRTYDEARAAVVFVRWKEGDADKFAPSLYRGHGGRRKRVGSPVKASAKIAQGDVHGRVGVSCVDGVGVFGAT